MRNALRIIGIVLIAVGLLWIGQGTGYFPYPRSSFMINQSPWIIWGLVAGAAGFLMLWASRRLSR
jgi:hypothetical protein